MLIGIVFLTIPSVALVEVVGYVSVHGVAVNILRASRNYSPETYPQRITFYISARVRCQCLSPETGLNDPSFDLAVDSIYLATAFVNSTTIASNVIIQSNGVEYGLRFETTDFSAAETIGARASNRLDLVMTARATAGLYQKQITVSDSGTWMW